MAVYNDSKECPDRCPKCNSGNIDYGCSEGEGNCRYYPFTCLDCGCEGKEWYREVYQETVYNET